jgi:AcrR family transcriptional regulator
VTSVSSVTTEATGIREQILDSAEELFYARGIQVVGMAELRAAVDLPLKRIYRAFPGKDAIVAAFLRRRHERMMAAITAHVEQHSEAETRVLAIFDWLRQWFREPDFRGCPWMNAYGELGPTNAAVAAEVHHHQREFRALLTGVPTAAGFSPEIANAVYLLAEGAVAAAAVQHTAAPALEARRAVQLMVGAVR